MKVAAWAFCVGTLLVGTLLAADAPAPPAGDRVQQPGPAPSTPGSLLEEGALDETAVPVTLPTTAKVVRPRKAPGTLAEGDVIVDRLTSIARDASEEWWVIQDDRGGQIRLLPCELLEAIERERTSPDALFRLSGVVHQYHGGCYLLPRMAARVSEPVSAAEEGRAPETSSAPAQAPSTSQPTIPLTGPSPVSAEDIARQFMQGRVSKPILPASPAGPQEHVASVAPAAEQSSGRSGEMIVHRLGRLLPAEESGWPMLAFESDNTLWDPPMRILPSRQLEQMEGLSRGDRLAGVVFHVSGRIHRYHGKDYVLLLSVSRKQDMGQF